MKNKMKQKMQTIITTKPDLEVVGSEQYPKYGTRKKSFKFLMITVAVV